MSPLLCLYCDAKIRGNAAAESYNPATGTTRYTCRRCARGFAKIAAANIPEGFAPAGSLAVPLFCDACGSYSPIIATRGAKSALACGHVVTGGAGTTRIVVVT